MAVWSRSDRWRSRNWYITDCIPDRRGTHRQEYLNFKICCSYWPWFAIGPCEKYFIRRASRIRTHACGKHIDRTIYYTVARDSRTCWKAISRLRKEILTVKYKTEKRWIYGKISGQFVLSSDREKQMKQTKMHSVRF